MNRRFGSIALRSAFLYAVAAWALILAGCNRFDACEVGRGCRTLEPLDALEVDIDVELGWNGTPSELRIRLVRPHPGPGHPPATPIVPDGTEFRATVAGFPPGTTLDDTEGIGPRESSGPHQAFDISTLVVGRERSLRFTLPARDPQTVGFEITAWNFDLGYLRGSLVVSPPLF